MKTDKSAPVLLARLPNNRQGRAALAAVRSGWNREGYKLRVLFSGPRERGAYGTVKKNAKVFRIYADRNGANDVLAKVWRDLYDTRNQRDVARKDAEHWAEQVNVWIRHRDALQIERDQIRLSNDGWQRLALNRQDQLNAIPAWVLYLVGAWNDARRLFNELRGA